MPKYLQGFHEQIRDVSRHNWPLPCRLSTLLAVRVWGDEFAQREIILVREKTSWITSLALVVAQQPQFQEGWGSPVFLQDRIGHCWGVGRLQAVLAAGQSRLNSIWYSSRASLSVTEESTVCLVQLVELWLRVQWKKMQVCVPRQV